MEALRSIIATLGSFLLFFAPWFIFGARGLGNTWLADLVNVQGSEDTFLSIKWVFYMIQAGIGLSSGLLLASVFYWIVDPAAFQELGFKPLQILKVAAVLIVGPLLLIALYAVLNVIAGVAQIIFVIAILLSILWFVVRFVWRLLR